MPTKSLYLVIHILSGLEFGGIENLCLQIVKHPPKHVNNILINLNSSCQQMLPTFQRVPNLAIIEQPYQPNAKLSFIHNLTKTFKQYQPKAIFIYPFSVLHILVALSARLASIPIIAVHAGNPPPQNSSQRYKWRFLVQASRWLGVSIHCCSQTVHKQFQSFGQLPRGSFPIPNGCNVENIAQRANQTRQQRLTSELFIIGMVSRLNAIKDHDTLIRAFAIVQKQFPNTALWIVGDGDKKVHLENLARELDIEHQVVFLGGRSDVPELLGQMDISAFSTTASEGFGIALIEAMAAKLPIVATDVAACREVLAGGEAGLLVSPENPEALANALKELIKSQEQRQIWGKQGFERALSQYTSQACAEQWYQLLLHN
jgi:glycosyltransferase involved in cell wall biosynthesis